MEDCKEMMIGSATLSLAAQQQLNPPFTPLMFSMLLEPIQTLQHALFKHSLPIRYAFLDDFFAILED